MNQTIKQLCRGTVALLACIGISATNAAVVKVAGERAGHWDASLFLNYVAGEDLDYDGFGESKTKDNYGWGFGFHYNFNAHWNLGFDLAFNRPDYRITVNTADSPNEPPQIRELEHTASRFDGQVNAQYNFLAGPITPFIQAGLGWTTMDSNVVKNYSWWCGGWYYPYCRAYANTYDDTSFSYNLGLGLRWDVTDSVFLRGAFIQQWVDTDGSPEPRTGRLEVGFMF